MTVTLVSSVVNGITNVGIRGKDVLKDQYLYRVLTFEFSISQIPKIVLFIFQDSSLSKIQ